MKFELVRYGKKEGILLDGNLMATAEILPFLQEFSRVHEVNELATRFLEHGRSDDALRTLKLITPC